MEEIERFIKNNATEIFEQVLEELQFNEDYYTKCPLASEGLDEANITDYEMDEFNILMYEPWLIFNVKYNIKAQVGTYEYQGKDPDTKEDILSDYINIDAKGTVELSVVADVKSNKIIKIKILDSSITGERVYYDDTEYDEEGYTTCPICGCKINFDNDAGNGFCIDCSRNEDFD